MKYVYEIWNIVIVLFVVHKAGYTMEETIIVLRVVEINTV